jgi:integrase
MAIRKRGKSWMADYIDITGQRVRKTFKTRKEADIFLTESKANKNRGFSNILDKNITLEAACKYFLETYVEIKNIKAKTKDEYTRVINRTIIPYFGNIKLYLLAQKDVEKFILYLKKDKKLSSATINKYKILLGSIIERQIENGTLYQNVVRKIHCEKIESKEAKALSKDEINILLNTCKRVKPEFYPMLATAVFTGMRRGEIIALMWENVDLSNNIIKVKYSEYKAKLTTPKSKASCRNITISTVLKKILIEQKLKTGNGRFVFPNSEGNMFLGSNIYRRYFKPVMDACNIGHFKFHDLRHTYGSQLIENGISLKKVQKEM